MHPARVPGTCGALVGLRDFKSFYSKPSSRSWQEFRGGGFFLPVDGSVLLTWGAFTGSIWPVDKINSVLTENLDCQLS